MFPLLIEVGPYNSFVVHSFDNILDRQQFGLKIWHRQKVVKEEVQ